MQSHRIEHTGDAPPVGSADRLWLASIRREPGREAYGEQRINLLGWRNGALVHLTDAECGGNLHFVGLREVEKHEIRRYIAEASG